MPLQEAIIFGATANLVNPAGVGFGAPCSTRGQDAEAWQRCVPKLRAALREGDAVGLLVQTRNGRRWDEKARNPKFNYDEDYLVAAYRLAATFGTPWLPGRMIMDWVNLFSLGRARLVTYEATPGMEQMFQCSPKGCALSKGGSVKMVSFHERNGASREEAINIQMRDMVMPKTKKMDARYNAGWIGGYFASSSPKTVRGPVIGMRPPNYQAPTPPRRK